MPRVTAIIPARLGSTRLPGKVLLDRTGTPLICHVADNARRAPELTSVVVATDDARVGDAVRSRGGEVVMTSPDHPNGTSRLAEAIRTLGLAPSDVVVNVQGDEPEIEPEAISAAVRLFERGGFDMTTVASPFLASEQPENPNIVKVVRGNDGRALYFSRALIPHAREAGRALPLKHIGMYVYSAGFLVKYAALPPTPLEQAEMLEQLRALEHGMCIGVAVAECRTQGIDTPEQYEAFVQRWLAKHGQTH